MNAFKKIYALLIKASSLLQSPLLLVVRGLFGFLLMKKGWGDLQDINNIIKFFGDELHLPFPVFNAYLVALLETVGGGLLVLGLASRLICIPLIISMIVAYFTAHRETIDNIRKDPDGFLSAAPFPFLFAFLFVLSFGPGVFSLDYLLGKIFLGKSGGGGSKPAKPSSKKK